MSEIFISYARSDHERVEQLVHALHSAGYSAWLDSDLAGGVEYSREIEARIQACKAVVVVWSAASVESNWVADEAEIGRDAGKLVPLVIDGTRPKIGFRQFQAVDFSEWTGNIEDPCFQLLERALEKHVGPTAPSKPAGTQSPSEAFGTGNDGSSDPIKFDPSALQTARPALTPLVGRETEERTLTELVEKAKRGEGGLLLIGGQPGVGKTRLAEECLAIAQKRNMLTLAGHAHEESGEPFVVPVEIIQALMRVLPDPELRRIMGNADAEIARLVPSLRRRFPDIPPPIELAPEQQQRHLYNAMLDFTKRLTTAVPCVILLDDLQWADESSLNLLEHIAPNITDFPLLYVATYRDVASDMSPSFRTTLANLNRLPATSKIALKQLAIEDVAALIAKLGRPNPPENLVEIIFAESGGNALFAQSIYQNLAEEKCLFDANGDWRTDFSRDDLVVPNDVRLIIEQRVERLAVNTRKLLVMAAILGLRFDPDVLQEALECDDDELLTGVEEAEAANLLFAISKHGEARYEFSHALVRQSILDLTTPLRQERLHLKAAKALESLFGDDPSYAAALARHLISGGKRADSQKITKFLVVAGNYASDALSFGQAIFHYDAALLKISESDRTARAAILERRGYAHRALGDWAGSEKDWLEAIELLQDADEPERRSKMAWEVGFQLAWQNRTDEGENLLRRTLSQINEKPSAARARLLALLGHYQHLSGRLAEGDRLQREAIEMAKALNDLRLLSSEIMFSRLYFYQHTFNVRAYLDAVEETTALQQVHGSPSDMAMTVGNAVVALQCSGQFDQVRSLHAEMMPICTAFGDFGTAAQLELFDAIVDTATGKFECARQRQKDVVKMFQETGMPWTSAVVATAAAPAILAGDWKIADAEIREAVETAVDCPAFKGIETSQLLYLRTLEGDSDAFELLRQYQEILPIQGRLNSVGSYHMLLFWVECAVLLGDDERAFSQYESVNELLTRDTVTCYFPRLVERVAGIAAMAGAQYDKARLHFEAALDQAGKLNLVSELGETRRWYAMMLLRRQAPGDVEKAQKLLREAIKVYEQNGMPKHVKMAKELIRE